MARDLCCKFDGRAALFFYQKVRGSCSHFRCGAPVAVLCIVAENQKNARTRARARCLCRAPLSSSVRLSSWRQRAAEELRRVRRAKREQKKKKKKKRQVSTGALMEDMTLRGETKEHYLTSESLFFPLNLPSRVVWMFFSHLSLCADTKWIPSPTPTTPTFAIRWSRTKKLPEG